MKTFYPKTLIFSLLFALVVTVLIPVNAEAFFGLWNKKNKVSKSALLQSETSPISDRLTLDESYRLALKKSEDIGIKIQELEIVRAHFYQALDVVLPDVKFQMSRFEQDAASSSSSAEGFSGNLLRPVSYQKKFTLHQPIFSGFKEFALIQGSGNEKAQKTHEKRRAQELLYLDVAEAYFTLLEAQQDQLVLEEIYKALDERSELLKSRAEIGRSRDSEVQSSISEMYLIQADMESAKQNIKVARELLSFYIDRPVLDNLVDETPVLPKNSLSDLLAGATKRSDVLAAEYAYRLYQKKVTVAQAGLFPTIGADVNYYTQRNGVQSGVDWDTEVVASVPIFDGMQTIGNIKEAVAQREMHNLNFLKAKRMAELDIKNNYWAYEASRLSLDALEAAKKSADQNYQLNTKDYETSLISNLEVLDALRRYSEIKRRYIHGIYEAKKNYYKLKVASGDIPQ